MKRSVSELKILTYNIHKGITASRQQIAFSILKEAIKSLKADIVLLQEVAGTTRWTPAGDEERTHQLEALADEIWPYHAYQRNSAFSGGYHGNAILSRFPILESNVLNISVRGLARRGALHGQIGVPHLEAPLHVVGTHLGLLQYERHRQVQKICHYLKGEVPAGAPLIIGGDFNDWRQNATSHLNRALRVEEVFLSQDARHARTFPSKLPVLRLDRIYFRGFQLRSAMRLKGRPWHLLSDHLPVLAHFSLRKR